MVQWQVSRGSLTASWLAALLLSAVLFTAVVAIVGISDVGELAIGSEGTLTHYANTTLWSGCASFGSLQVFGLLILVICAMLAVMAISLSACMHASDLKV